MSATETFSVGKLLGKLLTLLAFVVLTALGIRSIPRNPRVGWFAAILFGVMSVLTVVEIVRICGLDQDKVPNVNAKSSIRSALVYAGTLIATIVLGLTDNFISESFTQSFPRPGVWLGTFLTTLAFHPLHEQKEDFPNLTLWAIFCALLGMVSVGLSYFIDLLEQFL